MVASESYTQYKRTFDGFLSFSCSHWLAAVPFRLVGVCVVCAVRIITLNRFPGALLVEVQLSLKHCLSQRFQLTLCSFRIGSFIVDFEYRKFCTFSILILVLTGQCSKQVLHLFIRPSSSRAIDSDFTNRCSNRKSRKIRSERDFVVNFPSVESVKGKRNRRLKKCCLSELKSGSVL